MTSDPVTVTPQMPAYRAAEILATYKFGALPVVEGDQLVGIITVTDILQRFVSDQRRYAGTTEGVIEGDEPRQRKIEDG
jgi:CBS domain-containing protein